jgi:Protein of unknown function (DUF2489)
MANPDERTSYLRKLVSVARSIVTYQVGIPLGCTRAAGLLTSLEPFEKLEFPVFAEFRNAVLSLPIGTERLHWDRAALRERDIRLEKVIRDFRDRIFDACYVIIDRYGSS